MPIAAGRGCVENEVPVRGTAVHFSHRSQVALRSLSIGNVVEKLFNGAPCFFISGAPDWFVGDSASRGVRTLPLEHLAARFLKPTPFQRVSSHRCGILKALA
jgi:hypothetical protein